MELHEFLTSAESSAILQARVDALSKEQTSSRAQAITLDDRFPECFSDVQNAATQLAIFNKFDQILHAGRREVPPPPPGMFLPLAFSFPNLVTSRVSTLSRTHQMRQGVKGCLCMSWYVARL